MLLIPKAALRLTCSIMRVSLVTVVCFYQDGRSSHWEEVVMLVFKGFHRFMVVLVEHSWCFGLGVASYMLDKSSATKLLSPAFNSSLGNKMEI